MTGKRDGDTKRGEGLDALYKRPGFLLRRAHQISVSLFMSESAEIGATTTQYGVLTILRHCEGLDQIGLSKKVGLDRSTTGLVVKKLADDGLVVRVEDPQDRRRKIIVLTAKGERHLESLRGPAARAQEIALSAFTPDEAEQFLGLLGKFVDRFNDVTRAPIVSEEAGDEKPKRRAAAS
ncbi:MarR family transcriptional regulator [Sphingosinicella sp. LHD-64]|uniref:MarR family winged helix-turn-helix transcriptional regulator n=1 Tax=Sphingosinicella sp. LHD-64 TaxID=3072139 RepID=UPI00280C7579|nr:MarR family transcriptional regulator [Sphingosinicella sp. LHD-64]MDQ8756520.1 MarR family transcriptional regulator [Sphingosinicella sp. LHD-64]